MFHFCLDSRFFAVALLSICHLAFLPSFLLSSKSTSISPVINIFALLVIKAAQYFTSLSNFSLDAVIVVMEKYEAGLDLVWLKWVQEEGYATLKEGTKCARIYCISSTVFIHRIPSGGH